MPLPQEFTPNFAWPMIQKATDAAEVRDWFAQYRTEITAIDADVKLNRVKAVFQSDTTPETLVELNSNSIIHNGTLATQTYNLPEIDADNIGMQFVIISEVDGKEIVMDAGGADTFIENGVDVGGTFSVNASIALISAIEVGKWNAFIFSTRGGELDFQDFTPQSSAPTHKEGRVFYDSNSNALSVYNDLADVRHALGREIFVRCKNNSGDQIDNGEVVYVSGVDGTTKEPTIELADADAYGKNTIIGVATMDIPDGTSGEVTAHGQVNGIDTSLCSAGLVYLDTTPGKFTSTRPQFPAKAVVIGYVLEINASTGSLHVDIQNDTYDYEFEGTVIERQDTFVLESGGTVYAETELLGGGDLPVQLEGDVHLLDCTTGGGVGGRARVALTAGTDSSPQFNFVYIELIGGVPTLSSSVTAPTGAYAFVSYVSLWSAAKTATDGPALHQRSTDAIAHNERGRIAYIDDKLRRLGSTWASGVDQTVTITTQGAALDDLNFSNLSGLVFQLHAQIYPSLDVSINGCYVANASGAGVLTPYQKITNLNQAFEDTAGNSLSGTRYNLVVWGMVNKTTGECKLFVNLPTRSYTDDEGAYYDVAGSAVTSVDTALFSSAFLISRIPIRHTTPSSGTIAFINPVGQPETINLLGLALGSNAGGAGGGGGAATLNGLTDVTVTTPAPSDLLVYNNSTSQWENGTAVLTEQQDVTLKSAVTSGSSTVKSVLEADHWDSGLVRFEARADFEETHAEIESAAGDVTFKDQHLSSALALSQTGQTGLSGFSALSIVGALNELRIAEISNSTTDDSTTTLTTSNKPRIVVTGDAINRTIALGNATTYPVGFTREISNASDEFIGVTNGDSSVWERLPPNCTMTCILTSNGTSNGTWIASCTSIPMDFGFEEFDDFLQKVSKLGWNQDVSGGIVATAGAGSNFGQLQIATNGSSATDRAGARLAEIGYGVGSGQAVGVEFDRVKFSQLSDGTDSYTADLGLGDSHTSEHNDAVLMRHHQTSGNWQLVTASGGSVSLSDTGISVTTAQTDLRVEVSSDGSRVDCWIDRVHGTSSTSNIPAAGTCGPIQNIRKTAGTTNVNFLVDTFRSKVSGARR